MIEKKRPVFYKVMFILANQTKDKIVFTKKISCDFWMFWVKTHPGLHYKQKKVKTCMQNFFFCKIYNLAQKQICSQVRNKKILPQNFVFVYEKSA